MRISGEVIDRVRLSIRDLFDDADGFSREIDCAGSRVIGEIVADVARAFVDLNLSPDDLPPDIPIA